MQIFGIKTITSTLSETLFLHLILTNISLKMTGNWVKDN